MWRTQIREEQSRIEAEKRIKYKGTARIRLKWLQFQRNRPREVDDNNVERLKADFRKDCRDLDERNHIAALIDQQSLDAAELLSGVSVRRSGRHPQGGYPELVFPAGYRLDCLHGQHRILAAKELGLEWWTVDLYLADLDLTLKTYLVEEYSNEKKPSDGEIYRKIRDYHFQGNLHFEWRWWSRLSLHGQRCLRQLLRHEELTSVFDALRWIPGFEAGMRLHTWNTILAMKCDDLILHYAHNIRDFWTQIIPQDASAMQYVDEVTVNALELRAPRVCTRDADELRSQILGGTIFSAFSEQDRVGIWARLQTVDGLVPSLDALFKNLNYVNALADCMRRLVRPLPGETVTTALFKAFADTDQRSDRAIVQVAESSFTSCPANWADRADLGVRQLYAYAMRHYLQMPRDLQGPELLARHTTNADATVLRGFADLAERLGFESPEITALKKNPQASDIRNPSANSKPLLVTDGAGVKKMRRCGLPSIEEYVEDSKSLFINHLLDGNEEQGEGLTSFFVRKSIYSTFFGKPSHLPLEELHLRDVRVEERERQEQERQEQERREQERREQERREQEKQKQEEQERKGKAKQQQVRRSQAVKDHQERLQRIKLNKRQGARGRQVQEQEESEKLQNPTLEDERRLEDQQRVGMDEILDIDPEIVPQTEEDVPAESSGTPVEGISSNTTVRINFRIRDGGIWKPASAHTIEISDRSDVEKVATNWVRRQWRLFNTELRMLAPQQCYDAVIANGTYTILLIRESELNIDHELLLSAMKIGVEAKEQGSGFGTQENP